MTTFAQSQSSWKPVQSPELQKVLDAAVQKTLESFASKKVQSNDLAATVIDIGNPQRLYQASFRGDAQIYPASVIKLFYLAAAHRWMEDGKIQDTPELRRAMRDMIVDSSNEATHYIIDLVTETTSGPELAQKELETWWEKRNAVNRYFASQGYANINANKKPWNDGPYGREMQATQVFTPKRNQLTTDATARLMSEIAMGKAVSAKRSQEMLEILKRDPFNPRADSQSREYTGRALPAGAKLWSKAGWTSETRHDCACVELPNGRKLVLVIFTVNHANEREIIPMMAGEVIQRTSENK